MKDQHSYYDVAEASAHHFCEGVDDERYLSIRFNFAAEAVKKATRVAMPSSTPLGRITINDRGETVATAAGELFEQIERIGKNPFQQDERMSEVVYLWFIFVDQYAAPFLRKKQQACERKGKKDAARQFTDIIEQLSNMVTTISKTKTVSYQSPKNAEPTAELETFTYFIPKIPADQFRAKGEELLAKEEEATKQLFTDTSKGERASAAQELIVKVDQKVSELLKKRRETARKQKRNGVVNAKHIKSYNNEQAAKKPEKPKAVEFARELIQRMIDSGEIDANEEKPKNFWKDILAEVEKQYPNVIASSNALRMAVCRKENENRGKYNRSGKPRGKYKPRK